MRKIILKSVFLISVILSSGFTVNAWDNKKTENITNNIDSIKKNTILNGSGSLDKEVLNKSKIYVINNISDIEFNLKGKKISGEKLFLKIDKFLTKKSKNRLYKKKIYYSKILKSLEKKKSSKKLSEIVFILNYGLNKTLKEIEYTKIHEIIIGKSELGIPIKAYYKGNPKKGFFGIFANIHGGYEYGTYDTALYLKEEFEKSGKTGWFIIPTINPDGLKIAENDNFKKKYYLKARVNSNNVDLNRNFCTKNYKVRNFTKKSDNGNKIYYDAGEKCESEQETQNIVKILKNYKFNQIISLHSKGAIFYIPDNTLENKEIIKFGRDIKEMLVDYDYDPTFKTKSEQKRKTIKYEIDEGGVDKYTGLMEQYIYENYNIPVIIIEFKAHGEIEKRLFDIGNKYLKN